MTRRDERGAACLETSEGSAGRSSRTLVSRVPLHRSDASHLTDLWPLLSPPGTYVLRFDSVNQEIEQAKIAARVDPKTGVEILVPQASEGAGLTLDERAVMLATAISS